MNSYNALTNLSHIYKYVPLSSALWVPVAASISLLRAAFKRINKENPCRHQEFDLSEVAEHDAQPIPRDSKGRCRICWQEKLAARHYQIRLIIGIFFPFALQALDVIIVASALPFLASDLVSILWYNLGTSANSLSDELSTMIWIILAFSLCSATFVPFWGQIVDIFG